MNRISRVILLASITAVATASAASLVEAGPRHGRILRLESAKAEFFVEANRTVSMAFYNEANQPQPHGGRVITVIAEAPGGKQTLEFEPKGDLLISKSPLPEGNFYNVVVQVREKADGKPKNFRIVLDLNQCVPCGNPEYACTCN